MIYLTKEHGTVINHFFDYPVGQIVMYPGNKQTGIHQYSKWFYHPLDEDLDSWGLNSTVCEDLVAAEIIIPLMNDIEHQAQLACGTRKNRAYILQGKVKEILRKDFVDYLENSPIIWL